MKKLLVLFSALALLTAYSCSDPYEDIIRKNREANEQHQKDNPVKPDEPETPGPGTDPVPGTKVATLLDRTGWSIDTLRQGLIYYNFEANDRIASNAAQIVNVLELDLNQTKYRFEYKFMSSSTITSNVRIVSNAIAAVNAAYEADISYIKTNGVKHYECPGGSAESNPGGLRWWKHEGAVCLDPDNKVSFIFEGTGEPHWTEIVNTYKACTIKNIYSSSPMLIYDYVKYGENFVGDYTTAQINSFESEDYRHHQGVRHPRTVVAMTEDNDLLLITIDGRWTSNGKAFGMSAKEVTKFIAHYFNPQYALNMDGGGSTSMAIEGHGDPVTNIVNYPTDNNVFDHSGERSLRSFFIIKEYK